MKKSKVKKLKKKKTPEFPFDKSRLRSSIRKEWMWSELRKQVKGLARIERGKYKCNKCSKIVDQHNIEIDHILAPTPPQGLHNGTDWGQFIDRLLFCGLEGLQALCTECHLEKTEQDKLDKEIIRNSQEKT